MNRTADSAAALLALRLCALAGGNSQAQAFPSKPIKVVIPFVAGTPEEFGKFMKAEVDRWTAVVNRGGIKPD